MRGFQIRLAIAVLGVSFCFRDVYAGDRTSNIGVPGGFCVQLGANDLKRVTNLARTGRYLVHILEQDKKTIAAIRQNLHEQKLYGLVSIDRWDSSGKLPYAENLVNLIVMTLRPQNEKPLSELMRVLCPRGVVLVAPGLFSEKELRTAGFEDVRKIDSTSNWLAGRKPWPASMDQWSHPRHSASGNAVSADTQVGPPRRIRWVAGPWQEVSSMVSADGHNYYGGLITRDSFNGLGLWKKSISPSPSKGGFNFRPSPGSAAPVAGDGRVFVFSQGKLQAVDGSTGKTLQVYAGAEKPQHVLYDDGILISVNKRGVKGFDANSGKMLWIYDAREPKFVVTGDNTLSMIQGNPRRGEKSEVVTLNKYSGRVRWKRDNFPWASKASRCVYYKGMLTFEVSTLNNDGPGNAIHIVNAADGKIRLDYGFLPGMNHFRQARAMFVNDTLWLLHGGRGAGKKREATNISAIDYRTGQVKSTYPAGLAHCFPPVATPNFLFSGELNLTDLRDGKLDANRITKAACGRDNGWVPANGLIYVTPKHCVCWPMLRGYAALAPARPGGNPALRDVTKIAFPLELGVAAPRPDEVINNVNDWPSYRHDAWRSGSTPTTGPSKVITLWSLHLGHGPNVTGPINEDWEENPFVKGPITPPVIAGGKVYLARPDAHEVLAIDASSGKIRWRFTANGRVDSPPTIHRGLCLFGSKSGWVYCLRADNGQMVWRLRAAPLDERIVAYGGLESPWPVPGSVLVTDNVAYFAAGRQSLADGGILVFAVDPPTGKIRWTQRLDTVPQKGFYRSSGLEFDNFDLLFRQGEGVAMSRWVFNRKSGKMSVEPWAAFAQLNTGGGSAMVPQGNWSYAPRNQKRTRTFDPNRPLVVFRDNVLFGCRENRQSIYRRDFNLEAGEKFNKKWITGWAGSKGSNRKNGLAWRSQRLAKKAKWTTEIFHHKTDKQKIAAMVLAGDKLYLGGTNGDLRIVSTDGKLLSKMHIPSPIWDGFAVNKGKLYISTKEGKLLCLGEENTTE